MDLANQILNKLREHNRKIMLDCVASVAVGLVTCVLVFGGVFWLSWLAFTVFLHGFRIGSAATSALLVTCVFATVSIWSAWRRHDPLANLQAMDPVLHDLQLGAGYALGIPVVNRQSIAGFAALLIGGPANLFDAWSIWRSRWRIGSVQLAQAAHVLEQCRSGVGVHMIQDRRAALVLVRLGLAKAARESGTLVLRTTLKGQEALFQQAKSGRPDGNFAAHLSGGRR